MNEHASPEILAAIIATFYILFSNRTASKKLAVRKLSGVEQIEYGVAQAAESGSPVVFSTGITSLGPVYFACVTILKEVLKKASRLRTKVLIPQNSPECVAYLSSVLGSSDDTTAEIHFLSEEQFAFASGYMGLVHRSQAGACFLFGQFAGESLILSEAGRQVGAFQVAGSVSPEQAPFFICSCDYTLIGEELFAAGAYISRDPKLLGNLRAQDILKLICLIAIVAGTAVATWRAAAA